MIPECLLEYLRTMLDLAEMAKRGELTVEDAVRRWETEDFLRGIGESDARAKKRA